MPTLDVKTLAEIRQRCEKLVTVDYDKPAINAAAQAVEDTLTSAASKNALNNAINVATSPTVLSAAQKLEIVKGVLVRLVERWT